MYLHITQLPPALYLQLHSWGFSCEKGVVLGWRMVGVNWRWYVPCRESTSCLQRNTHCGHIKQSVWIYLEYKAISLWTIAQLLCSIFSQVKSFIAFARVSRECACLAHSYTVMPLCAAMQQIVRFCVRSETPRCLAITLILFLAHVGLGTRLHASNEPIVCESLLNHSRVPTRTSCS